MTNRLHVLAGCVLLLAAAPLLADEAEDQAVKAVEKLGGKVKRDDKDPAKPVVGVGLSGAKVTDAGLKELSALKELKELDLHACPGVTDAGLKNLVGLKELKTLYVGGTKVTDAGLKNLATLKGLQMLELDGTGVTDAGLKDLATLKDLRELRLADCKGVTDAGVAELQKALPDCKIDR